MHLFLGQVFPTPVTHARGSTLVEGVPRNLERQKLHKNMAGSCRVRGKDFEVKILEECETSRQEVNLRYV